MFFSRLLFFLKSRTFVYSMLSVILCGIALNSYYSIQKKDGLYVDEIFSFVSSNSKTFTFHDFVEFVV